MRIVTVVGARPQFIKAAPVSAALRASHDEILVHTGQHYDDELSAQIFADLGLRAPDHHLGIHGGSHDTMVGRMLIALGELLRNAAPSLVLVYGDTNSTLAAALAAAQQRIPVAHVEAGLRSFDRRMPEETNRVLTDHLASLLFCPSESSAANLSREGINRGVHVVGDVMQDAVIGARFDGSAALLDEMDLVRGRYLLTTIHRAENTDDADRLREISAGLSALEELVVLPLHPRTRAAAAAAGISFGGRVRIVPPLGYLAMITLEQSARAILTDSGGVQKEAYWLGVPCLTLRTSTEWTETIDAGWNQLVAADRSAIVAAVRDVRRPTTRPPLYGTPGAASRVAAAIASFAEAV